jgi:hypothetical protein
MEKPQNARNKIAWRARDKVRGKLAKKRGRETTREGPGEFSIDAELSKLPNETFITQAFQESHVSRTAPDTGIAIAVAQERGVPQSTTLFLEGGDYQALADDIRHFHRVWYRGTHARDRRSGEDARPKFTTDKAYPYVQVTPDTAGGFTATPVIYGRIRFSMVLVGHIDLGEKQEEKQVWAINHLDEMFPSGQADEKAEDSEVESEKESSRDESSDSEVESEEASQDESDDDYH